MFLLSVLALISGAILKFVDPPFFEQAHQTGTILMVAGGALLALLLVVGALGKRSLNKFDREVEQRFRQFPRF